MDATDGATTSSRTRRTLKGIKVFSLGDKHKVGVAANSLSDLINKACVKLKISRKGVTICLPDGTLLDKDYFDTLDNQTAVVLLREGETLHPTAVVRFVERLLATSHGPELQQGIVALLSRRARPGARHGPVIAAAGRPDCALLSGRSQDPDWFKDLDTAASTKEEYMRRRCEARVRGYYYKSRDQLRAAPAAVRPALDRLMAAMFEKLRADRFHGHYFDRGCRAGQLCDAAGEFACQGAYAKSQCGYDEHRVNPYRSREDRIVFSTWNLDHRIERSRTIVPSLIRAAETAGQPQINWEYFYRLLFTTANLRLVHVVCHDKSSHDNFTCDQRQVFVH